MQTIKISATVKIVIFTLMILSCMPSMDSMEKKPYHHLSDGTFRNPEGSPERDPNVKWSYKKFNEERKKIITELPADFVIPRQEVIKNLESLKDEDFIAFIGHATFLIKLGDTTIITDPHFSKNAGPLIFGPKRYVDPAINLKDLPKVDLIYLSHLHFDHYDRATIRKFPYKNAKVVVPLKVGKYFKRYKDVNELDWYEEIKINDDLKITLVPNIHWSKISLFDYNKSLWAGALITYKDKKILFNCDTGYGNIFKKISEKYGPIDLTFINIGAYSFEKMGIKKSIYHATPEEALQIGKDLKSKKIIGMHAFTFVLSLEPIMQPYQRFKDGAEKYGYKKNDAIIFKIGQVTKLNEILN